MPVTVPSTQVRLPLREQVRMFLRDVPGRIPGSGSENLLLGDVEFSDPELDFAKTLAVSNFNSTKPPLRHRAAEAIPLDILLTGIAAFLMNAESFRQLRNQSTAQDGEVPLGIDDKHGAYLQLRRFMMDEYVQALTAYKIQENLKGAWGGVSSGFDTRLRRLR